MSEALQLRFGKNDREVVLISSSAITYRDKTIRFVDLRGYSYWVVEDSAILYQKSTAWILLRSELDEIEISDSASGLSSTMERLGGFMKMLSVIKRTIVPKLVLHYFEEVFIRNGVLKAGQLTISSEGVGVKTLFGEKFCKWEWEPKVDVSFEGTILTKMLQPSGSWQRQSVFYFISPATGKRVELCRLTMKTENAGLADEFVRTYGSAFCKK